MTLTENRLNVLKAIAKHRRRTIWQLREIAPFRVMYSGEWAAPHCRWLLEHQLIAVDGKQRCGSRIFKITDAGRDVLAKEGKAG